MIRQLYQINNEAYTFEHIVSETSLFDNNIINATYIIHLEGNGRYENIKNQLEKYKTTSNIYILHNKGFKKSKKHSYINKPPLDLVDAFLTCFKHAYNNNYKNVLIFEDDFILDKLILEKKITNEINEFVCNNNETFAYHLGVLPLVISTPINNHFRCIFTIGAHATIYSEKFIKYNLECDQETINDWDEHISFVCDHKHRYAYNQCLCYQPFEKTENSKFWGTTDPNNYLSFISFQLLHTFFELCKLDVNPEIGFNLYYKFCQKKNF